MITCFRQSSKKVCYSYVSFQSYLVSIDFSDTKFRLTLQYNIFSKSYNKVGQNYDNQYSWILPMFSIRLIRLHSSCVRRSWQTLRQQRTLKRSQSYSFHQICQENPVYQFSNLSNPISVNKYPERIGPDIPEINRNKHTNRQIKGKSWCKYRIYFHTTSIDTFIINDQ